MALILLAEHDNQLLSEQTERALTAALQIDADVDILVAGLGAAAVAAAAATLRGVRKVLLADAEPLEHRLAEPTANLLIALADRYETFLAPATSAGKNILPRVAALLDVGQVSEIVEVISATTFKRPIYAGNVIQTLECLDTKKAVTVRTSAFARAGAAAPVGIETLSFSQTGQLSSFVANRLSANDRPDLAAARIVISGGRALGSKDNFEKVLLPVADKLGAAIGASRAAVDAGYAPNDWQVGQTGKIVAPDLYLAVGISGAIQHLAGMKDSKIIVAVNTDADAPIFQIADYGLVGDLFEVLPNLEKAL